MTTATTQPDDANEDEDVGAPAVVTIATSVGTARTGTARTTAPAIR